VRHLTGRELQANDVPVNTGIVIGDHFALAASI